MAECNEGILKWVEINQILELEMPFTAKEVLRHYLLVCRFTNDLYAGVASDNKVIFHELKDF